MRTASKSAARNRASAGSCAGSAFPIPSNVSPERAWKALEALRVTGDEQVGVTIIKRAIEEPMRWIAGNAGHEGSIVVQRVKEMKGDEGFNAQSEQYEDLVKAGVIDPAKVVRSALQHAASIASLLLTTEAVISELAESRA